MIKLCLFFSPQLIIVLFSQTEIRKGNSPEFQRSVMWLSSLQDLILQLKVSAGDVLLFSRYKPNIPFALLRNFGHVLTSVLIGHVNMSDVMSHNIACLIVVEFCKRKSKVKGRFVSTERKPPCFSPE